MTEATGRTGTVSLTLPEGWQAGPNRDEYELLALLPAPSESFGPTVVVTVNPYDGGIAEFLERALEGIASGTAAPQIVDIRPWGRAPESGRSIAYTQLSPTHGLSLFTTDFLFIERGLAVQVTATATVQQWQFLGPLLHDVAASARLAGANAAGDGAGAALPPVPAGAVDPVASAALGHEVEKIDGLVKAQPFEFDGAWIHGRSLEVLTELCEGLRIGSLNRSSYAEPLRALEELEFVDGAALTDLGSAVGAHLVEPQASYRITGLDSGGESWFQAWAHGATALLVAEPGYHRVLGGPAEGRPSPEHFNLQLVPLTMLSTLMARWVGLQPAWNLALLPSPLPVDDLARGWTGDRTPPAGSNAAMRAFWDEPWFSWTLTATGVDSEPDDVAYLNGGRVGHQRMFDEGSAVTLSPTDSTFVFLQLEDRIQATIFGRRAVVL